MKNKNLFSRCTMFGVLALAAFSFQAFAQTPIGNYQEFRDRVLPGVADSFVLTANIDCKGENFRIIGKLDNPFIGKLNGNNFVIHSVKIDASDNGYAGLFGYLGKGAVIENLGVIADTVKGAFAVGVLAGGSDGTIRRCFSKGVVIADASSAGGLVGLNGGIISESYSEASARGNKNVGGLVGMQTVNVSGAGITDCYAAGAVDGKSNLGGLAGYVFGGSIRQCIASGKVTKTSTSGGLIGYDYGSVNTGWKTSGKTGSGETVQKADIAKCFWNTQTTLQNTSAGSVGKNLSEGIDSNRVKNVNTYDWSESVWVIGDKGPRLKNAPSDPFGIDIKAAEVVLSDTVFIYNGLEQKPEVRSVKLNGKTLKLNTDYIWDIEPEYQGYFGDGTNAGIVKLKIEGIDEYSGYRYESYTIKKAPGAAVGKPEEENVTHNSITIKPINAGNGQQVEYAITDEKDKTPEEEDWQDAGEFGGLKKNTDYYIFARSAGDSNYETGLPSAPLEVTTETLDGYIFDFMVDNEKINLKNILAGESVTLSVNVESSYGGSFQYRWYLNTFSSDPDDLFWNPLTHTGSSFTVTPPMAANYSYKVIVTHIDRAGGLVDTFLTSDVITVAVTAPAAPDLGKKSLLSAVTASGAVVKGRTLVFSASSVSGMQVRFIDMRGRTAARFVSGRAASFPLSGLPVGRYIVEVRDRGKRVSALPVFLK